jgi:hypothetical protein
MYKGVLVTRGKSFSFQDCREPVRLTTEILELFAIFVEFLLMSLRDTTSARMQESTVTLTVVGVATEEAMLFKVSLAIRGRN